MGKKSHSENNIHNNDHNVIGFFFKKKKNKKQNLLTYINVFMENSLNESEENSQSCPAKTWFYVTDAVERPKWIFERNIML